MKSDRLFVLTFSIHRAYRYIDVLGDSKDARMTCASALFHMIRDMVPKKNPKVWSPFSPHSSQPGGHWAQLLHGRWHEPFRRQRYGRNVSSVKRNGQVWGFGGPGAYPPYSGLMFDGSRGSVAQLDPLLPQYPKPLVKPGPQAEHLGRCQWPARHLAESSG